MLPLVTVTKNYVNKHLTLKTLHKELPRLDSV